jgi:hypothetical protein
MEPRGVQPKKRKLTAVYILYVVLSLLMVAGVLAMAKYMDQN